MIACAPLSDNSKLVTSLNQNVIDELLIMLYLWGCSRKNYYSAIIYER